MIAAVSVLTALMVCAACSASSDTPAPTTQTPAAYTVTIADCANGKVTASPTSVAEGDTVMISISSDKGYELDTIGAAAGDNAVPLNGTGNARTFKMPAGNVTVTAVFKSSPAGFVKVLGGTVIGSDKFKDGQGHTGVFVAGRAVTLSSFYMCDHEVTQKEWAAVMGNTQADLIAAANSLDSGNDRGKGDNNPVYYVNWFHAIAYCNKLSIKEGFDPCYSVSGVADWAGLGFASIPASEHDAEYKAWSSATCNISANGYRLPTDAEWDYAARGGAEGCALPNPNRCAGTDDISSLGIYAWYYSNSNEKTQEVKKKEANELNLFDMTGNVCEWCWDVIADPTSGDGGQSSVTDPLGGSSPDGWRVYHGGSWNNRKNECNIAHRDCISPDTSQSTVGFRVVRKAN